MRHVNMLTAEPVEIREVLRTLDKYCARTNFYPKNEPLLIEAENSFEYVLSHDVFSSDRSPWFIGGERFAINGEMTNDFFAVKAIACYPAAFDDILKGKMTEGVKEAVMHVVNVNFDQLDTAPAHYLATHMEALLEKVKWGNRQFSCEQVIVLNETKSSCLFVNLHLSCALQPRKSSKYPDQDRYALIATHLDHGCFSRVDANPETLRIIDGRLHKTTKPRVRHFEPDKSDEEIKAHDSLLQRLSFLKAKPSFILSKQHANSPNTAVRFERRIKGKSFEAFLAEGIWFWPLDLRCRLAIAALRALKAQVHDNQIIHMDIKPGNLMFCVDDPNKPEVNVIDFNLSRDRETAHRAENKRGTPLYYAPEVWNNNTPREQRDIFALSVTLGQLFGATLDHITRPSEAEALSKQYQFLGLFKGIANASKAIRSDIERLLLSMVAPNPDERPALLDIAARFEEILININDENLLDNKNNKPS